MRACAGWRLQRVEGWRLREEHQDAAEGAEEVRVLLRLEQVEPHVREDRGLDQLHQLVDLEEEREPTPDRRR